MTCTVIGRHGTVVDQVIIGRRAAQPLRGFDPSARTLTFVAATELPCPATRIGKGGEPIVVSEILVAAGCSNVGRMNGPLLDSHDRSSVEKVMGSVVSTTREGDTIVGTARLSPHDKWRAFDSVFAERILDSVSAGYTCVAETWDETTDPIGIMAQPPQAPRLPSPHMHPVSVAGACREGGAGGAGVWVRAGLGRGGERDAGFNRRSCARPIV